MRILLTNDDGIHAPGLKVLEGIARQFSDDIWICADSSSVDATWSALCSRTDSVLHFSSSIWK